MNCPLDRRAFLLRLGRSGGAAAVLAAVAYSRRDLLGPELLAEGEPEFVFPDYRVAEAGSRISIATGEDRASCARVALDQLGGLGRFVQPGDQVLLKVNAAFALPPLLCATTHPDLLAEVIRLCRDAGATRVVVTDNSINDPASCFRLTGIERTALAGGAEVVLPAAHLFRSVTVPGGSLIRRWPVLAGPFDGITKVIGLSPVKDHHRSGASLSLKNWYGLLGGRRNVFHQDIHSIIVELGMMIRPTLVLLDGVQAMVSNGPTGGSLSDLRATRTLIASTDLVAADACAAGLLGLEPDRLPYLARAAAAGLGTVDFESLDPVRGEAST
jgi:uncharacterized protein (DUF362 family)